MKQGTLILWVVILYMTLYNVESEEKIILFPISDTVIWSPVNPDHINCTKYTYQQGNDTGIRVTGYTPVLHKDYLVSGYLCTKIKLITKCEKNWLFMTDITYLEVHEEATLQECMGGIHEQKTGGDKVYQYPPPSCSYGKINFEELTHIHIVTREVHYDPYTDFVVSELFPGGKCKGSSCNTINRGQKWLPNVDHKPQCVSDHLDKIVYFYKTSDGDTLVWSPDMPISFTSGSCRKVYCGLEGILFNDGTWLGLNTNITIGKDEEWWKSITLCENNKGLKMHEKEYTTHLMEKTNIHLMLEKECNLLKIKLMEGQHISRVELQVLHPTIPGFHPVYRLNRGVLEVGLSEYRSLKLIEDGVSIYPKFQDRTNRRYTWNYWIAHDKDNLIDGPNGLFVKQGKLRYYLDSIEEYESALNYALKLETRVESIDIKKHIDGASYLEEKHQKVNDANVLDELLHWDPIKHYLILAGAIIVIIIIIVISIKYIWYPFWITCLNKYRGRQRGQSNRDQSHRVYYNKAGSIIYSP
ncbi:MAG: glycoprotein [Hangzhou tipula scripta rhabdovirus 1]|nr:MAG: glycoprotein [Hangzhou tipula scripta rhabdovirus 1]